MSEQRNGLGLEPVTNETSNSSGYQPVMGASDTSVPPSNPESTSVAPPTGQSHNAAEGSERPEDLATVSADANDQPNGTDGHPDEEGRLQPSTGHSGESGKLYRISDGGITGEDRRKALLALAGILRNERGDWEDFVRTIRAANRQKCAPRLDEEEVAEIIDIAAAFLPVTRTHSRILSFNLDADRRLQVESRPADSDGRHLITARENEDEIERDSLDLSSASERETFAMRVAQSFDTAIDIITETLDVLAESPGSPTQASPPAQSNERPVPVEFDPDALLSSMPDDVVEAARRMAQCPDLVDQITDDFAAMGIAGEENLAMTVYLLGTSRLLDKPLAAIVQGSSSAGKSHTVSTVTKMFPDEVVLQAHDFTANSLYYLPPGSLEHRLVVAGERRRKQDEDTTRAWRELIADGELRKCVVQPGKKTIELHQKGPVAFVETTTLTRIFDEDLNRTLLLHTDESPEQTRRIMAAIATSASSATHAIESAREEVRLRHRAFQLLLRPKKVVVPFADRLAGFIPTRPIRMRRAFPLLLSAIAASAVLHQFQRTEVEDDVIEATIDDYRLARRLISDAMADVLQVRLTEPKHRFVSAIRDMRQFATKDAVEVARAATLAKSKTTVQNWLNELDDIGVVELVDESSGSRGATWRLVSTDVTSEARSILPEPDELFDVPIAD